MPIGTPTSLATPVSSTSTTSGTITTSVTAPSDSLIIVIAGWGFGTDRTATVTGGGLTFGTAGSADQSSVQSFGYFLRIGIYSAPAASGLASGATFTLTPSANFDGSLMSAYYVTGMDLTGSRLDANTGAGAATGGWTSGSDTTTNADDLIIGGSVIDSLTSNTEIDTELNDWQFATNAWTACTAYRIESSAGSKALTGDWVANANHVAAMAGYKSGSPAEFTAGGFDLRNRLGRERGRFPLRGNKWY
jgi:hypothetical protein